MANEVLHTIEDRYVIQWRTSGGWHDQASYDADPGEEIVDSYRRDPEFSRHEPREWQRVFRTTEKIVTEVVLNGK